MTDSQSFQSAWLQIHGAMKDVRFLSKTYLWGQGLYQLLQFVLVEYGETQAILACTNLSMSAGDIIEAYACCFKILYEPCFYTNFSVGGVFSSGICA